MQGSMKAAMRMSRVASIVVLCGLLAAACSKKSGDQGAVTNGQVVAHVGDEVITAPELDNEFRLSGIPTDKQKDPQIVKRLLGELVTRKYLYQQAVTAKLDREPNVLLDVLRAREQVLANAYVARTAANKAAAISAADVQKYISNNPSKFSDRQLISVEQISFPIGANFQAVVESTKDAKALDDVDQRLTGMGVPHSRSSGTINGAELPDDLLKKMEAKKPDDVFFIRAGKNGVFLKVIGEETRPLDGQNASNQARQFLRADLLKAEIGLATVSAGMEAKYEGVYSKIMSENQPDKK